MDNNDETCGICGGDGTAAACSAPVPSGHVSLQVICYVATGHACALFTFAALDWCHFQPATSGIATDAKLRCLSLSQIDPFKILFRLFSMITLKLQKATAVQPLPVASAPRYAERCERPFLHFTARIDTDILQTLSCAGVAAARVGAVLKGLFKSCEAPAPQSPNCISLALVRATGKAETSIPTQGSGA